MTQITVTELKANLDRYLDKVLTEDIWITKDDKIVAKLVNPNTSVVDSLTGILKGNVSDETDRYSIRDERVSRYLKAD